MLTGPRLMIVLSAALLLAFTACGGDGTPEAATPQVGTPTMVPVQATVPTADPSTTEVPIATTEPSQLPIPFPTAASEPPVIASTPEPTVKLNGDGQEADPVSLIPSAQELTTVEVVKILTPSVVQIVTEVLTIGMFNEPTPGTGVGTGVILDTEGHILTNNHVIADAESITVTLGDGRSIPAEIVGRDPNTDLAVIRVEADGLIPVRLGVSSELEVGEDVIAIGHALGLPGGPSVSKGVVSALGRSIDSDQQSTIVDLIQTDASINPGNSGGALVNSRAQVIGINTAIIQGTQGIGVAINIDDAKVVTAQLIEKGYVERGFLGISPFNLTPGLAEQFGFAVTEGVIVGRVIAGTAAEDARLQVEDVIVKLGDLPIRNTGELSKFLIAHLPGETVDIVYYRGDTKISGSITLGDRPN